eukprot:5319864-Ditylum_brightwellii.AAC.1
MMELSLESKIASSWAPIMTSKMASSWAQMMYQTAEMMYSSLVSAMTLNWTKTMASSLTPEMVLSLVNMMAMSQ